MSSEDEMVRKRSEPGDKAIIKCVVWDLDNTLWQGTLLEGDDLVLRPEIRNIILELENRGILQSIASKNHYADAWERLSSMGLAEYFLHSQIGWGDKSVSIRTIAEHLGIGTDAVAFIDDQAFERDEVRFHLPDVTTIDAAELDDLLDLPSFEPHSLTDESKLRRRMYQADIHRKQAEKDFGGRRDEFLASLGMVMNIRPASEQDLHRAEELTIRTNQLNTTGRVYSYDELYRMLNSPNHLILVAELDDCYGTSGTIGLALIDTTEEMWTVRLLLMSCRVVSRGVGGVMLDHILELAKHNRVKLRAAFVANDRNRMMYVTYKFHGFFEIGEQDGTIMLEHSLDDIRARPSYVSVRWSDEYGRVTLGTAIERDYSKATMSGV